MIITQFFISAEKPGAETAEEYEKLEWAEISSAVVPGDSARGEMTKNEKDEARRQMGPTGKERTRNA
jgi:hypothetical protein